jgi:DNA replication protein DnaC
VDGRRLPAARSCLIFSGKSGRGKTALAIALAIATRSIRNGFDARFTTAAALIDDLVSAARQGRQGRQGRLAEVTAAYLYPDVLNIDEVGYLPVARWRRWLAGLTTATS